MPNSELFPETPGPGEIPVAQDRTAAIAERLRREVDWDAFFTLVSVIGGSLNSPKYRFIKSDFLEMAIDVYGSPALAWVDQEGWDHELDGEIKIEMKHHGGSLYSPTGKAKNHVGQIRMQNTLGGGESRSLHETFDYLLITDNCAAALAPWAVVAAACKATKDAIVIGSSRLPINSISYIVRPQDITTKRVEMPPVLDMLQSQYRNFLEAVRQAMK